MAAYAPCSANAAALRDRTYEGASAETIRDIILQVLDDYNSRKPSLSSDVKLIDASLDPHDSPYTESVESGIKKIQKCNLPKKSIEITNINNLLQSSYINCYLDSDGKLNHSYSYSYDFPTIDFKFQNTGNATAFVWQLAVRVIQSEIDTKPALDFKVDVVDNALKILVINNGWGTAYNCHIQVNETTLNRLFFESLRQATFTIESGKVQEVICLTLDMANSRELAALIQEFVSINSSWLSDPSEGRELSTLNIKSIYQDDKGTEYRSEEGVCSRKVYLEEGYYDFIVITQDSFLKISESVYSGSGRAKSDTTYITIIDPLKGSQELIYPISRKIPSGDIERFHIMIGSPMSCHLHIQFKFFIDQSKIVESEEFDIHIGNARDSRWHFKYKDGTELYRNLDELIREEEAASNNYWLEERFNLEDEILRIEKESIIREASNYPFTTDFNSRTNATNLAWDEEEMPKLLKTLQHWIRKLF